MLSILTSVDANAQENNLPSIDMNTSVKREVTPDEIYLRITINENDYRGRKTLEDMQSAMLRFVEYSISFALASFSSRRYCPGDMPHLFLNSRRNSE